MRRCRRLARWLALIRDPPSVTFRRYRQAWKKRQVGLEKALRGNASCGNFSGPIVKDDRGMGRPREEAPDYQALFLAFLYDVRSEQSKGITVLSMQEQLDIALQLVNRRGLGGQFAG